MRSRDEPAPLRGHSCGGYALFSVVILGGISLAIAASVLRWSASNSALNTRNNQYFRTVAAAEAATEKVVSAMTADYDKNGEYGNDSHLGDYRGSVPLASESDVWSMYEFSDGDGGMGRTTVEKVGATEYRVLSSQYQGLYGFATRWRVLANAREKNASFDIPAGVQQDLEMATIPLFQFAIFYNIDLEINPGPDMTITGPVHGNTDIYAQPQGKLTFQSDVTAAGRIIHDKKPGDPLGRSVGTIVYQAEHDGGVSTLNLPIGTNNSAAAVREVVERPPADESPTSAMGQQRFYNKADLVILVRDGGASVTSGRADSFGTIIPAEQTAAWLDSAVTFYNKREGKTVKTTQIDIGKLISWNATNSLLRPLLSATKGDIRTLYVADERTQTSSTESGVRLVNGQTLLPQGLTVATPNPLYVRGHYNCDTAEIGKLETTWAKPAALVADAITVLSTAWNDANSTKALSSRVAQPTTVNAALLAGIVPTVSGSYSGGVENFPRFLEDWSSRAFTYNGSMVVMFPSRFATAPWVGTGSSIGIYNPPMRQWAFDRNFRDPVKLPPGTPTVRALVRVNWAMVKGADHPR